MSFNRRTAIKGGAAAAIAAASPALLAAPAPAPKSVAAIVTAYEPGLHADVVLGKILEGWEQDGGPGPNLTLASMYIEQFGAGDLSRGMSKKHGVPIFDSIERAVTVGGDHIPVDGVISIGEHGLYPWNKIGQHLYPRRRFFKGITDAFVKYDKVVPVFNDKHLGPVWEDGKWMYDRAKELGVPFMAGSSLPVTFRKPELNPPLPCEIESALGVGYSGLDIYGSHTLDCYQSVVERRKGGERGVRWVQCLEGEAMWKAVDKLVDKQLLFAALDALPKQLDAKPLREGQGSLFLFEYVDGFQGQVLMLPEYVAGIGMSMRLKGRPPQATRFEERTMPRHPHFAYLLKAVERMMHTGKPSYPVERTLLTGGILDRALNSRAKGHRRLETPELQIAYEPVDYPHAPLPRLIEH